MSITNFFTIQAYSPAFDYIISNSSLYFYSNSSYSRIQNLTNYTNYVLKTYNNQLVIYGYNTTTVTSNGTTTYSIVQTIFISTYLQNTYSLIETIQINSTGNPISYIPVRLSP